MIFKPRCVAVNLLNLSSDVKRLILLSTQNLSSRPAKQSQEKIIRRFRKKAHNIQAHGIWREPEQHIRPLRRGKQPHVSLRRAKLKGFAVAQDCVDDV